jgi:hypothetical protein
MFWLHLDTYLFACVGRRLEIVASSVRRRILYSQPQGSWTSICLHIFG